MSLDESLTLSSTPRRLAHSPGLLNSLLEIWGEAASDRVVSLVHGMDKGAREALARKLLFTRGLIDALLLERALEQVSRHASCTTCILRSTPDVRTLVPPPASSLGTIALPPTTSRPHAHAHAQVYSEEDTTCESDPALLAELAARRRQSSLARKQLADGRVPKMVATESCLGRMTPDDDPLEDSMGGLKLTCDCARVWMMPAPLIASVKGEQHLTGQNAPALSIRRYACRTALAHHRPTAAPPQCPPASHSTVPLRCVGRYEDSRFESVEAREAREAAQADASAQKLGLHARRIGRRAGRGDASIGLPAEGSLKPSWHLSTGAMLSLVADVWNEVICERIPEIRAGTSLRLSVAAALWEKLLQRHGLKSIAQRALADLMVSLRTEAIATECVSRLRFAAEMIGLCPDARAEGKEMAPWTEAKCHFFFWALQLCLPIKTMRRDLADESMTLPLSTVRNLLRSAVTSKAVHDTLLKEIEAEVVDAASKTVSRGASAAATVVSKSGGGGDAPASKSRALLQLESEAFGTDQAESSRAHLEQSKLVPLDAVFEKLMAAWVLHHEDAIGRDEKRLVALTHTYDDNGDGVLDFAEFTKLVTKSAVVGSRDEVLPLYEETLARSQLLRQQELDSEEKAFRSGGAATRAASSAELAAAARGEFTNRFKAALPDAIDPRAFAQIVARCTRTAPPEFFDPMRPPPVGDAPPPLPSKTSAAAPTAPPAVVDVFGGARSLSRNHGLAGHGRSGAPRPAMRTVPDPETDADEIARVVDSLARNFLFASLESTERIALVQSMERSEHQPGTRLINQGDLGDYFYVSDQALCDLPLYDLGAGSS